MLSLCFRRNVECVEGLCSRVCARSNNKPSIEIDLAHIENPSTYSTCSTCIDFVSYFRFLAFNITFNAFNIIKYEVYL